MTRSVEIEEEFGREWSAHIEPFVALVRLLARANSPWDTLIAERFDARSSTCGSSKPRPRALQAVILK